MILRVSLILALIGAVVGCARALPPPGGDEDRAAPQIVATTPEPLSIHEGFEGEVVFRFDERISERGAENVILITPVTGETRVSRGRSEIRARIEGGWRPDIIYRVVLLPGVRDLFGNERRTPAELVFSTGPQIPATAIAGLVTDRITGKPALQAIVEATRRPDSLVYLTSADSQAFFALQNLPYGVYHVIAYVDANRNRRRDPTEARSEVVVAPIEQQTDTLTADLIVIAPDTTAPRVVRAEGRDSLQIHVFSDDWIDPAVSLADLQIRILALPDSTAIEGPHRPFTVDSFTVMRAREDSIARAAARADSLARAARDTTGRDTARADTGAARLGQRVGGPVIPPRRQVQRPATPTREELPSIGPLPYQELVVVPSRPLAPGRYAIDVRGLQNIAGRPGGGGIAAFEIAARRPAARDTTDTTRTSVNWRQPTATAGVALRILPRRS